MDSRPGSVRGHSAPVPAAQETRMSPTGVPEHISIDFREALDPGRGWIVGVADKPARVELLAFEHPLTEGSLTISSIDSALADRGLDGLPPRPRPMMVAPESRAVT